VVGLWVHRRAPRTDLARAGYVLWGGWLLTHAVVFSFASGILHPYYAVAMAPGVAGLVGAGVVDLWRLRARSFPGALVGAAALLVTAWWGHELLARSPSFAPGLGTAELALAAVAAAALLVPRSALAGRLPAAALAAGLAAVLLGPAAYAIDTAGHAARGATPSSGPAVTGGFGPGRGAGPGGFGGFGGPPPGGFRAGAGVPPDGFGPGGGTAADGGANSTLIAYLVRNQGRATWLVATGSSMQAAPIELATGRPVIAMGGFSGGDAAMTVDRLQELVRTGQLRYVLAGSGGGPGGGGSQAVLSWVTQHGTLVSSSESGVNGLYDLSAASSAAG
jgi:4-amino-4-deoxy-L-arabinose transferase-like glycosyltransferase